MSALEILLLITVSDNEGSGETVQMPRLSRDFAASAYKKIAVGKGAKYSIFHNIFKNIQSFNLIFVAFFQCCLKIENAVMI